MQEILDQSKQYAIGVIGDIPALAAFWELFKDQANDRVLAEIGIVAAALPEGGSLPPGFDAGRFDVFADSHQMLTAHPEINMVIEATGRSSTVERLRHELPASVTLVEKDAANFFIRLLTSEKLWVACKLDLLHTQNMLKTIVDQLSEDILFVDRDGYILDGNSASAERLGMRRRDLAGKRYDEVLNMREREGDGPCECPLERTLESGEAAEATVSRVGTDGRMRYYRVYTYPIFDEAGTLTHAVVLRRDITRRTNMELRLQQSEKLASIGELSTYIAHEIRNPLFAISGFANSLLRSDDMTETSREKLGIILEESKRLDGILRSILNFTRPTEARDDSVDINRVVRETMDLMRLKCETQGIEVVLSIQEDIARAKADGELIKQCLINLIKNAMEAMPDGGRVTVATGMTRDHVTLTVEDTGEGVPAGIRDKIFSPFFSTRGKGSGLGLAMIRKILDDIGGDVELSSVEGEGTEVTLYLPPVLAEDDADADAMDELDPDEHPPSIHPIEQGAQ